MKGLIFFILLAGLTSCVESGHNPSYIISEVEKEGYEVDE